MYHYTYMIDVKNPTDERCRYIGVRSCSVKPNQDFYFGSCRPFKKWQAANGTDGLVKTVLAWWPNREQALKHEILLHDIFDVGRSKKFWNQAKQKATGFDTAGVVLSEEAKLKKSLKTKGRPKSEEHKAKIKQALLGKPKSAEHRKKVSLARTGKPSAMRGKSMGLGRKFTEEHKAKISAARKAWWASQKGGA